MLLFFGSDASKPSESTGKTPVEIADEKGHFKVVEILTVGLVDLPVILH